MGFFDFLENIANKVGNAVGVAIETIGDYIPGDLGYTIAGVGISIQAACNFGEKHWNEHSDGSETATAYQHLDRVKEEIRSQAAAKEPELIAEYTRKVSDVLDTLDILIPAERIKLLKDTYSEEIQNKLSGYIIQYVTPKLSFRHEECKEIFDIISDDLRIERAQAYQNKLIAEACDSFIYFRESVFKHYLRQIRNVVKEELEKRQADFTQKEKLLQRRLKESPDERQIDMERKDTMLLQTKLMLLVDFSSM